MLTDCGPSCEQTTVEVRVGSKVTRVIRASDGVTVTAGGRTDRYDFLVVASPMPHSLGFLDASAEVSTLTHRPSFVTIPGKQTRCHRQNIDTSMTNFLTHAQEKALFSRMRYRQYTTEVVDLNGTGSIDSRFGLFTWADRLDSRRTAAAQSDYYVSNLGKDGSLQRNLVDRDEDDGALLPAASLPPLRPKFVAEMC
jgi:hypothetical protein